MAEGLAQAEDGPFRAELRREVIPLVAADGAEEDGVRRFGRFHRIVGQRRAEEVVGRAAGVFPFKSEADMEELIDLFQYGHGGIRDFFPDAVSRDDDDMFCHFCFFSFT